MQVTDIKVSLMGSDGEPIEIISGTQADLDATHEALSQALRGKGLRPPENWRKCFDATAITFLDPHGAIPDRAVLCHGLGIANAPGEKGLPIKHAWIEIDGVAFDCIWYVKQDAKDYRRNIQAFHVVEYSKAEALGHWIKHNFPGPWDELVKKVGKDSRQ
jgi:hypothetical protein